MRQTGLILSPHFVGDDTYVCPNPSEKHSQILRRTQYAAKTYWLYSYDIPFVFFLSLIVTKMLRAIVKFQIIETCEYFIAVSVGGVPTKLLSPISVNYMVRQRKHATDTFQLISLPATTQGLGEPCDPLPRAIQTLALLRHSPLWISQGGSYPQELATNPIKQL